MFTRKFTIGMVLTIIVLILIGSGAVMAQDEEVCLKVQPRVVFEGDGVSADIFVDNGEYRIHIYDALGNLIAVLDMETWAAYYVANEYGLPSIAFRSASDLAGGGPGANQIRAFFGLAAENAAAVSDAFFAKLSEVWESEDPVVGASAFSAELEAVLLLPSVVIENVIEIDNNNDGEGIIRIHQGTWHGVPVLLFLSRVSMVPSAHVMTVVLENFDASAVVFTGIAGGVDPNLNIGDVSIPAQWANHGRTRYARDLGDGQFDYESDVPNFGMIFHNPTEGKWWLPTDPTLLEVARAAADDVVLQRCTGG